MARKDDAASKRLTSHKHVGLYAGSFDPPTLGHLDMIERASKLFDQVIVGIGAADAKSPLFTTDERLALLNELIKPYPNVVAASFRALTIDFAAEMGVTVIIRGLRSPTDYDYEMRMAQMNRALSPGLETVFLPTRAELSHISSSLAKEIAKHGGNSGLLVPKTIAKALKKKFS